MSTSCHQSISDNTMILVTLNTGDNRSVSPMTPSPSREVKGLRLFRAISRKLARRSQEDICEDDSRSSSTDSCSSTSASRCSRSRKLEHHSTSSSGESGFRSVSPHHLSSSSSDAGSDIQSRNRHHHSTSADSIRKVFQNMSIRSQSCANKEKKKSKKSAPKKILRQPVTYTYVKGLSGLPTQRVPKTIPRMYMSNPCGCSMQYMNGLNR